MFTVDDTATLHAFCAQIGPKNCESLKYLEIEEWFQSLIAYAAFTVMASVINLACLDLTCTVYPRIATKEAARVFYRDCHPWLEAVGRVRGQKDAAVDLVYVNWDLDEFRKELRRLLVL